VGGWVGAGNLLVEMEGAEGLGVWGGGPELIERQQLQLDQLTLLAQPGQPALQRPHQLRRDGLPADEEPDELVAAWAATLREAAALRIPDKQDLSPAPPAEGAIPRHRLLYANSVRSSSSSSGGAHEHQPASQSSHTRRPVRGPTSLMCSSHSSASSSAATCAPRAQAVALFRDLIFNAYVATSHRERYTVLHIEAG
jgi:hypothetical protein